MLSRFFAVVVMMFWQSSAYAISNIESQRPGPPPEGWSGNLEFSASGKSGDVDEDRYGLGGRLTFQRQRNTIFGVLSAAEAKTQGVKSADESFAHLRWINQRTERVAVESFVQFQQNEFSNLLARYLAGGGGRFRLLSKTDQYTLYLGLGAFHEWEETDLGTFTDKHRVWRASQYISYQQQLNEQVNWFATAYFQPAFGDADNHRALLDTGLLVRLNGSLSLRLAYNLRHNSEPPRNLLANPVIDREKTNTQYTTSLRYEF